VAEHLSLTEAKLLKIKTIVKGLYVDKMDKFTVYIAQTLFPFSHVSTNTPVNQHRQINH